MSRWHAKLGVALGVCLTAGLAAATEDAVMLHAQALGDELDGNHEDALRLVRQAHAMDPKDQDIAFDLARMALHRGGPTMDEDVAGFMALEPSSESAFILRAYILSLRGDLKAARGQLDQVLTQEPSHGDARVMQEMLAQKQRSEGPMFSARFSAATQADSNVAVLPEDAPTHRDGLRMVLDGSVNYTPVRGSLQLDVSASYQLSMHLNDRENLQPYDSAAAILSANAGYDLGRVHLTAELSASEVATDSFGSHFMQDLTLQSDARWTFGDIVVGPFALAGVRDFIDGNPEGVPNDRDGPRFAAGALGQWSNKALTVMSRLGWQNEASQGAEQDEAGVQGSVLVRWKPASWLVTAGLSYQQRLYSHSESERHDNRLSPSLRVGIALNDWLRLSAAYTLTRNLSAPEFDYTRHLTQIGLEGRW